MAVVTKLYVESFKRLTAVSIEPEGNLVRITGKNGAGKSSVLDALFVAFCGAAAIPAVAVHKGAEKGLVEVHLDDPKVVIRRTFNAKGETTSLVIESHDGAVFKSPQAILDRLVGRLTFDPLAFLSKKPADQVEALLQVVELNPDPAKLDELAPDSTIADPIKRLTLRSKTAYDERTVQNRFADQAAKELLAIPEGEGEAPTAPVNITALVRERDEFIKQREEKRTKLAGVVQLTTRADDLSRQIAKLQDERDAILSRRDSVQEEAARIADPSEEIAALDERIDTAEAVNERYATEQKRAAIVTRLEAAKQQAADRKALIDSIAAYKAKLVGESKMPVDGLGWAEREDGTIECLAFNGIPLEQASQAEQIRVSAALAMAGNPTLKVMLVREGSLLDEDSVRLLGELAAARGFQVWIEEVDSTGKVGVVIEDGAVKTVNREAAPAGEASAS